MLEPLHAAPSGGAPDLERMLEALHAQSFAWALACCGQDHADAEDALQSAYLKVLDGRARFGGRSSFRTWLFGVIRRTASEERRRRWWMGRLQLGAGDTGGDGATGGRGSRRHDDATGAGRADRSSGYADEAPLPDAEVEARERAERLTKALTQLPRRQQEILDLVFYHEMTIEEAGVVIGVSLGTARTHYERGKKNLLKKLGDTR
jgi:RNA polymerase sigma factor (sigma-70 family)